ncbi:MAG TPA: hypothetical protein DE060_14865 [Lentisphaeria bacterium]|nr:hypothetical protein [Lentisphaeria bacterium]HCG50473.1 hypothetical protein [Lentisphaeria bacterium]
MIFDQFKVPLRFLAVAKFVVFILILTVMDFEHGFFCKEATRLVKFHQPEKWRKKPVHDFRIGEKTGAARIFSS